VIEALIYVAFAAGVLVPFIPGLQELAFGRDADPLRVDQGYSRDPRYLGKSLRKKIAPLLAEARPGTRTRFLDRSKEFARVVEDYEASDGARIPDVLISRGSLRIGERGTFLDVYAANGIEIGAGSILRTAASDGDLKLGQGCMVERWLDANHGISVGRGSNLGLSTSAGGVLGLDEHTAFRRVFGSPVSVSAGPGTPPSPRNLPDVKTSTEKLGRELYEGERIVAIGETVNADIIAKGNVELRPGCAVRGSIKSDADVVLSDDTCVYGSIVARGTVIVGDNCRVFGHIFAERAIRIGSWSIVGELERPKTVRALDTLTLSNGVRIYGWAIAENGGTTFEGAA
jgi:hypothetical protein